MGITGLLPFVKPASTERHLSTLRGQTAAIDSYCWLHKGAFGCADKIALGEETTAYVSYCFKYIDMLQAFRIKPIMVFDGRHLPAKLLTEEKRRQSRKTARKRATECLKLGKMDEARNHFRRCVDITAEMAFNLIKECRKRNINCIVAPYEADAQLAYLIKNKIADFVISEDSDLLTFGCSKVLFKLDINGVGVLVEEEKLHLATQERPEDFSLDKFRYMCILSGCDYLESLPGIGLKKALKFLKCLSSLNMYECLPKLPSILNMKQLTVTKQYRDQFMLADATFKHQLVFDIVKRKLVPLTDPESCGTDPTYCANIGGYLDDNVAFQIAIGNLNPFTLSVMSEWNPDKQISLGNNIWNKSLKVSPSKPSTPKRVLIQSPDNSSTLIKEEDTRDIGKELVLLYSSIEPPTKKLCLHEEVDDVKQFTKKSPTFARKTFINPFLKKARLSSNKSTEEKDTNLVVSKYFCSESQTTVSEDAPSDCTELKTADQNINQEIINVPDDLEEDTENNVTTTSQESTDSINKENHTKIIITPSTRSKIEFKSCRTQGLSKSVKKKFNTNSNQPTLLSMFGFSKK